MREDLPVPGMGGNGEKKNKNKNSWTLNWQVLSVSLSDIVQDQGYG